MTSIKLEKSYFIFQSGVGCILLGDEVVNVLTFRPLHLPVKHCIANDVVAQFLFPDELSEISLADGHSLRMSTIPSPSIFI